MLGVLSIPKAGKTSGIVVPLELSGHSQGLDNLSV
jgi:hypothetical protein